MDAGRRNAVHVVRPLDFADIDVVGFDLDHTLAVYDDARVNALAYEETCERLVRLDPTGFGPLLDIAYDESQVCRGLLLDTDSGTVVKPDHGGRVVRARRGAAWLSGDDLARTGAVPREVAPRYHPIHSPFDLPTAFFFQHLTCGSSDFTGLCRAIRRELDAAHTRGRFKRRVLEDVEKLVLPLSAEPFERLRESGKRLFVLTNSEAHYSEALLDRLFGERWRYLFDAHVADAKKPTFFGDGASRLDRDFGVDPGRVLYIGDSVMSDTLPARAHGWRAAHVVQELDSPPAAAGPWGSPLVHDGVPTWFAGMITAHADVYARTVSDVIAACADGPLDAAAHPLAAPSSRDCP